MLHGSSASAQRARHLRVRMLLMHCRSEKSYVIFLSSSVQTRPLWVVLLQGNPHVTPASTLLPPPSPCPHPPSLQDSFTTLCESESCCSHSPHFAPHIINRRLSVMLPCPAPILPGMPGPMIYLERNGPLRPWLPATAASPILISLAQLQFLQLPNGNCQPGYPFLISLITAPPLPIVAWPHNCFCMLPKCPKAKPLTAQHVSESILDATASACWQLFGQH